MLTRCTATLASIATILLVGLPARASAQCTSSDVRAGGVFTKLDTGEGYSLTIINLSDAPLDADLDIKGAIPKMAITEQPTGVRWDCASPPFYKLCSYDEMNENVCHDQTYGFHPDPWEIRVEKHDSAIWKSASTANQAYEGTITFTWRSTTFYVKFRWQKVYGSNTAYPHFGTWTTLDPGTGSWCGADAFCSGVWATAHDYDMRNITTLATAEVVVSLYSPNNRDVVLVLRETYWNGWQGDAYHGKQLDWVDNDSPRVPGECNH